MKSNAKLILIGLCLFIEPSLSMQTGQGFQQYLGTYDRKEANNYLEFLDDLGLNKLLKRAATASNPVLEFNYDEETKFWSFKTCTKITCNDLSFKIGEQYNRKTRDGRQVIIKAIQKGDKITIEEKATKETEKSTKSVFEFKNNQVVVSAMVIGSEVISEQLFLRRD